MGETRSKNILDLINRKAMATYIVRAVYGLGIAVEVTIILRFILKFFGASDEAAFVRWLYDVSFSLIHPFWGAFPSSQISGRFMIEFSSLFAILIYWLAAYLILSLVEIIEGKERKLFGDKKKS